MSYLQFHQVTVNGVRGRDMVLGDQTALSVIVLASALVRGETYIATAIQLANNFNVYVVELPGSGSSSRLSNGWELTDYAAWVAGFIHALALHGSTVIGHSHSGGIVILLVSLHTGKVGRLVVADSIGVGGPFSFWPVAAGRIIDTVVHECSLAARAWHHVAYNAIAHPSNYFHQVRLCLKTNLDAQAASIQIPILLAWGEWDRTIPVRFAHQLKQAIPHCTLYVSAQGSHAWPITHAKEFADVTGKWVQKAAD